jgi:hypothetical protein
MKNTTAGNRGYSILQFNYNIRRHLKIALIFICLFTWPVILLLNILAGACYGY